MYANVLKFRILIPHEKISDPYFFLFELYVETVLESGSWGHSILQILALVFLWTIHLIGYQILYSSD